MKKCKNCGNSISERNIFCNNICQREQQYKDTIENWLGGKTLMSKGCLKISNHIRRYLFESNNNKCSKCGWCEINIYTNKIPLEVDHIDGDSQNNSFENLRLLCPNCHSLTKTWKNTGNRKSTRTNRNK